MKKKKILAYDLTRLVHGEAEAQKAKQAAIALFSGSGDDRNMPTTRISADQLTEDGIHLPDLMVLCKIAASKAEARRLIQQGGVSVNDVRANSFEKWITRSELVQGVKLQKGKKVFHKAIME